MIKIGIVGHEAAKFTKKGEEEARKIIYDILTKHLTVENSLVTLVSGGCHLGGIDIFAEEEADKLGLEKQIFLPKTRVWESGYKPRNIKIAKASDELHNIVVSRVANSYDGMKFPYCYHCHTRDHYKSGGCWTAKFAHKLGKPVTQHVLLNEE